MHDESNARLEERRSRLEKLIQKVQGVETQVAELGQDLKDIEPKLEAITESMHKKREKIKQLMEAKAQKSDIHMAKDDQLKELRAEVDTLKEQTSAELEVVKCDMQGTL